MGDNMEGAPGFEPEMMRSKLIALPLGYAPIIWCSLEGLNLSTLVINPEYRASSI